MIRLTAFVPKWIGGTSLSLVVLASYLRFCKPYLDIRLDTHTCDEDPENVAEDLASSDDRVFGFSVYMWNLAPILAVSRLLKSKRPDAVIVYGGPTASYEAERLMNAYPFVDVIVKGEGEIPLLSIIDALESKSGDFNGIHNLLHRQNGRVWKNSFRPWTLPLEEQQYPLMTEAFEDIDTVYYETSRGCVFTCAYCAWNINQSGERRFRYYPLEKILPELRRLMTFPRLERLLLTDSNILLGRARTKIIFQEINKLNAQRVQNGLPRVKINFEFNPEHLTDEMLTEIKTLHVENYPIGLQSVTPEVLKEANRPFHRERYVRNLEMIREKAGAAVLVEVIYGLPLETYGGFRKTLEFVISELKAELFVAYRFSVLPGSKFWEDREKYGIVHEAEPPYFVIETDTFSREDFERVEKTVYYLQLIYRVYRSLKKTVDTTVAGEKLPVYEAVIDMFYRKYGDFLTPKLVYDDEFTEDVEKLRRKENADIRKKMLSEARKIVKRYAKS